MEQTLKLNEIIFYQDQLISKRQYCKYENNNENNFETSKLKNFENKFPMYKLNDNRGIFKFEKTFDNPTRSIKQEQEELDTIPTYLSR